MYVLQLLLMLAVMSSCISVNASGAALSTTITDGTFTSSDDSIAVGGTTLDVQLMLNDAFIRTIFGNKLTIALPASTSAWASSSESQSLMTRTGMNFFPRLIPRTGECGHLMQRGDDTL